MTDRRREVEDLRRQMAEVDLEILRTLQKRAELAREVGELRTGSSPGIPAHEAEQLEALERAAGDALPPGAVKAVFREVHAVTLGLEISVRAAYVSPEGGLCQAAALRRFGPAAQLIGADSPAGAFDEVTRKRADFAVVPFESSREGPILGTVLALSSTDLVLVAEVELSATLDLMSRTGNLGDVDKLYVTAADRLACQRFVAAQLPRATVFDVRSPLLACALAGEDHGAAVILPTPCAVESGLSVVQSNVGDEGDLRIRFGIIAPRPASRSGSDTTAFIFSVHDEPGALFDVLRHFAERGINLKTIQSRPVPGEKWNYFFYVEVTGHVTDRPVVTALEAIKRQTRLLRVLGSFPSA